MGPELFMLSNNRSSHFKFRVVISVAIGIFFMFSALIYLYVYWYLNTNPYQVIFVPFSNNSTGGNIGSDNV